MEKDERKTNDKSCDGKRGEEQSQQKTIPRLAEGVSSETRTANYLHYVCGKKYARWPLSALSGRKSGSSDCVLTKIMFVIESPVSS